VPVFSGMDLAAADGMVQWRIGCSGYYYNEWKGLFYPQGLAKNKWLEYYSERFNTVELNNTFYRFPRVSFLKGWYNRCPEHFCFSVKAPRLITHFKRIKSSQQYLAEFYDAIKEGLREKLGCVLFQFPPAFHFDAGRLEQIIEMLDPAFSNVVEFRHPTWWHESVFEKLAHRQITFSGMSHPSLPSSVVKTANTLYYRFHGVPHLYTSKYEGEQLEQVALAIRQHSNLDKVFIYFNNTAEGAALANAIQLQGPREFVH
jgi:uncharacterized protein YecE (DUF72 family)